MKQLYAPWRSTYATSIAHSKDENSSSDDCVFCTKLSANNDDAHFIIKRGQHAAVLLNLYPYNAGHLLVIPYEHVAPLHSLSAQARAELIELASISSYILQSKLNAHGINIGLNLGQAAGAGIPAHIHLHVLPRYTGDTNFLPTLGQTKQISFDMQLIFKQLKDAFNQL